MEQLIGSRSRKEYVRAVCCHPVYLYTEHIIRNICLNELQSGIRIGGRNINKLIYADDTTVMIESEEELKSCLMRVKEESERACLKLNIKTIKILGSSLITSWQMKRKGGSSDRFPLLGL